MQRDLREFYDNITYLTGYAKLRHDTDAKRYSEVYKTVLISNSQRFECCSHFPRRGSGVRRSGDRITVAEVLVVLTLGGQALPATTYLLRNLRIGTRRHYRNPHHCHGRSVSNHGPPSHKVAGASHVFARYIMRCRDDHEHMI